jgi:hypothetical protein
MPATLGVIPASFDYAGDVDIAGIEAAAAFADAVSAAGLTAAMANCLWDAVARADPTGTTSPPPPAAAVKQRKQHAASACPAASPLASLKECVCPKNALTAQR